MTMRKLTIALLIIAMLLSAASIIVSIDTLNNYSYEGASMSYDSDRRLGLGHEHQPRLRLTNRTEVYIKRTAPPALNSAWQRQLDEIRSLPERR